MMFSDFCFIFAKEYNFKYNKNMDQELIKQCEAEAQKWLSPAFDAETQAEVKAMLDNEDKTPLIDAFYQNLEFGTGGLRGIMGAGTNRMNKYIVGMATQGFANYINKAFAGKDHQRVWLNFKTIR